MTEIRPVTLGPSRVDRATRFLGGRHLASQRVGGIHVDHPRQRPELP